MSAAVSSSKRSLRSTFATCAVLTVLALNALNFGCSGQSVHNWTHGPVNGISNGLQGAGSTALGALKAVLPVNWEWYNGAPVVKDGKAQWADGTRMNTETLTTAPFSAGSPNSPNQVYGDATPYPGSSSHAANDPAGYGIYDESGKLVAVPGYDAYGRPVLLPPPQDQRTQGAGKPAPAPAISY